MNLPTCPYCEKRPVSVGKLSGKANRTCGHKDCIRVSTSQSAAKLSVYSTTLTDFAPRGFRPTGAVRTTEVAGTDFKVKLREYRNPDGVEVWSKDPPKEPPRHRGVR